MARSKRPITLILTLALMGALGCVIARYFYLAYVLTQAGESLDSVPFTTLAIDVMELHWFGLIGAGAGAVLGAIIALIDILAFGQRQELTWKESDVVHSFVDDEVKAQRMQAGADYLEQRRRDPENSDTPS